jgi:hypothetical protein
MWVYDDPLWRATLLADYYSLEGSLIFNFIVIEELWVELWSSDNLPLVPNQVGCPPTERAVRDNHMRAVGHQKEVFQA